MCADVGYTLMPVPQDGSLRQHLLKVEVQQAHDQVHRGLGLQQAVGEKRLLVGLVRDHGMYCEPGQWEGGGGEGEGKGGGGEGRGRGVGEGRETINTSKPLLCNPTTPNV